MWLCDALISVSVMDAGKHYEHYSIRKKLLLLQVDYTYWRNQLRIWLIWRLPLFLTKLVSILFMQWLFFYFIMHGVLNGFPYRCLIWWIHFHWRCLCDGWFLHNCVGSFTFSLCHFLHATIDLFNFYLERIYDLSAFE